MKIPAIYGAKIAPSLPMPIPQPIPVVLKLPGYILAAIEYKPTKPPCIVNPKNAKPIKIKSDDKKNSICDIIKLVITKKDNIVFFSPNFEEI